MKTIMIVVGGMADLPDESTGGRTPLMMASTPALDALAKCGCCGLVKTIPDGYPVTTEAAVLSLLGYDFSHGIPSRLGLEAFGAGTGAPEKELRPFVVPKFSGHGGVVTRSPLIHGIGRMAMLRPCVAADEEGNPIELTLPRIAATIIEAIEYFDFVLAYVGSPHERAIRGDLDGKIEAIEDIDSLLVRPVADYVWNAKMQMNLVVTGDHISSWRRRSTVEGDVPAVVYFNDDLPYDTERFNEETVEDGPLNAPLPGDLIRRLVTFEPTFDEEETR